MPTSRTIHASRPSLFPSLTALAVLGAATAIGCGTGEPTATSVAAVIGGAPGDFAFDGNSDILFQKQAEAVMRLWVMDGTTPVDTWVPDPYGPADANWKIVATPDLSDDGRPDFLFQNTTSKKLVVWHMRDFVRQSGGFINPPAPGGTADVKCAYDFDGNNTYDIVFQDPNPATRTILISAMDGVNAISNHGVTAGPGVPPLKDFRVVGCGDFSGEGLGDLVVRGPAGAVFIAFVEGYQAFEWHPVGPQSWDWSLVAIGDYNRDGHYDLVFEGLDHSVIVWLMQYEVHVSTVQIAGPQPGTWNIVGPK